MSVLLKICLIFSLFLLPIQVGAQKLSIYAEDDHPLQFIDESGKVTGFVADVVKEIQRRVKNNDPIQIVPWSRGLNKLDNDPNTLLFSMAKTQERTSKYQWVGPIFSTNYGFYVNKNSPVIITSLEDAKNIGLIGVYREDIIDSTLTKEGFHNLDRANSNISNFKKLMINRIAAYVDSPMGVKNIALKAGYSVEDVRLAYVFKKSDLYIAVSNKTNSNIVKKWNNALEEMKKDKSLSNLLKKYNLSTDLF